MKNCDSRGCGLVCFPGYSLLAPRPRKITPKTGFSQPS